MRKTIAAFAVLAGLVGFATQAPAQPMDGTSERPTYRERYDDDRWSDRSWDRGTSDDRGRRSYRSYDDDRPRYRERWSDERRSYRGGPSYDDRPVYRGGPYGERRWNDRSRWSDRDGDERRWSDRGRSYDDRPDYRSRSGEGWRPRWDRDDRTNGRGFDNGRSRGQSDLEQRCQGPNSTFRDGICTTRYTVR